MTTTPNDNDPATSGGPSWGTPPSRPPFGTGDDGPRHDGPSDRGTAPNLVPAAAFFDGVRRLGVVRPDEGRRAAGVCAGLARRWNVEPKLVRLGFVVLTLLTGVGLALYGLAWLLLPHPDGRIHAQQAMRGVVTAGFVGGLLAVLADLPSGGYGLRWQHGPGAFPLVLIGLAVWWFVARRREVRPGR